MFIFYDVGIFISIFCFLAFAGFGGIVRFFAWIAENNTLFIACFLGIFMLKSLIIAFRGRRGAYMPLTTLAGVISSAPLIAFYIYS